jgi:peptidylprolyl isomerase
VRSLVLAGALAVGLSLLAWGCGSSTDAKQAGTRVVEVIGPHGKLKIRVPPGKPPKGLVVKDLREGSGPAVESVKDEIVLNYAGLEYAAGKAFYDSWEQGGPSRFILQETHPGWERGLIGMKVGGLRELITPPGLAYHTTTLIYIIEMIRIRHTGR